uniref:Uncharacterized protein n=1 Tax=Scleropages formosus TaxID=113540 RepID=A0A8C9V8E9_SCLFO
MSSQFLSVDLSRIYPGGGKEGGMGWAGRLAGSQRRAPLCFSPRTCYGLDREQLALRRAHCAIYHAHKSQIDAGSTAGGRELNPPPRTLSVSFRACERRDCMSCAFRVLKKQHRSRPGASLYFIIVYSAEKCDEYTARLNPSPWAFTSLHILFTMV